MVVVVEDADELLARKFAELASRGFLPVNIVSANDQTCLEKLDGHKTGEGTLILLDVIRTYGNNPLVVRAIREIALQDRDKPSRLILIETPGTQVPQSIMGDIEYIVPKVPTVDELKTELEDFLRQLHIKLPGNGEVRHEIASAVAGLPRHEASRLFSRCYVEKQELDVVWLRREKATRIAERLGGALTFVDTNVPNMGGVDGLKKWLASRKQAFLSEDARRYGLPEPKGILLLGIPGVGKSLTPKTIGNEWGLPLLRLDAGKLFASLVGQSESQTRQAIAAAEACAPCILWIDEIEKGFAQGGLDGGTSQRVFGTMLTWLQEKVAPVFVVATANRVDQLPPELLRKGRFDEIFFVDLPTPHERAEIAAIHLARRGRKTEKFSLEKIAAATEGFSGSEIEQLIIDAMFAAYAEKREVTQADIVAAVKGTVPLSKTMDEQLRKLRAWADGRAKKASLDEVAAPVKELKRQVAAA